MNLHDVETSENAAFLAWITHFWAHDNYEWRVVNDVMQWRKPGTRRYENWQNDHDVKWWMRQYPDWRERPGAQARQ